MEEIKIQWHPGFVAAMVLEFGENRKDLIYEKEYNLNTKPLEIDLLVIKKGKDVRIVNEIGRLFRGHNIMEYKSPKDELNIDTFYKAGAYAGLYNGKFMVYLLFIFLQLLYDPVNCAILCQLPPSFFLAFCCTGHGNCRL